MKSILTLIILAVFTLAVTMPDADARRFGGGASFGKQRMQQTAPQGFSQQKAAPRPAAGNPQRGTARTGMMGMLGGLAMGGLLGAMFFGGAFEGVNFLDILVIGVMVFLVVGFLRRKAMDSMAYAGEQGRAFGNDYGNDLESAGTSHTSDRPASRVTMLRPEIDEKHFLRAARDIFMRMQTAWDAKDMQDIRRFCTSEVADWIESEMQRSGRNSTEVTTLHAGISDAWVELSYEWVAVGFEAMMSEKAMDDSGRMVEKEDREVHETWIFRHDPTAEDPTWFLAGIQQH